MKPILKTENQVTRTEAPPAPVLPATDIRETKEGYHLAVEMPGVNRAGVEVTVENGELVLVGRRSDPELSGPTVYRESRRADYRRVFELDPSIDATKIVAKVEAGVLHLALPKAEAVKPRKIPVAG
jgi:HSP20 family protein